MSPDPQTTYVISVGIGKYNFGSPLEGACEHALRFVDWALGSQVPPQNVVLFLSKPENANIQEYRLKNDVSSLQPRDPSLPQIHLFLQNELPELAKRKPSVLYLYWAAHGALNEENDRRVVLLSDSTPTSPSSIEVEQLLRHLRSFGAFPQQFAYFEACAIPFAALRYQSTLNPYSPPVPKGVGSRLQRALFSCTKGEYSSDFVFSRHVLAALHAHDIEKGGWPPNHDSVVASVHTALESSGQTAAWLEHYEDTSRRRKSFTSTGILLRRATPARTYGRRRELAELSARVKQGEKVIVLKGMAGAGKATLAHMALRSLAHHFPDGARDLELCPLPRVDEVVNRILSWLCTNVEKQLPPEYQEAYCREAFREAKAALAITNYEMLLRLTNSELESVRERAQELHQFFDSLAGGASTLLITTQQAPAHITREREGIEVKGLDLIAAMQLYRDHAAGAWSDSHEHLLQDLKTFGDELHDIPKSLQHRDSDLLALIKTLGGHPQAIRLVAAAVAETDMPLSAVHSRLSEVLNAAVLPAAQEHHRTMKACVEYALNHLGKSSKTLLEDLSYFHAFFDPSAAQAICPRLPVQELEQALQALYRRQLLEVERDGWIAYSVKPVIRLNMPQRVLDASERKALHRYHSDLLEGVLNRPSRSGFRRAQVQMPDLVRTFEALAGREKAHYGVTLAHVLSGIGNSNHAAELLQNVRSTKITPRSRPTLLKSVGDALHDLGRIHHHWGETQAAETYYEDALKIRRRAKDNVGECWTAHEYARLLRATGRWTEALAEFQKAESQWLKAEELEAKRGLAWTKHEMADLYRELGRLDEASRMYEECYQAWKRLPDQSNGLGETLNGIANLTRLQCTPAQAFARYEEAWNFWFSRGLREGAAGTLHNIAVLLTWMGIFEEALRLLALSRPIFEECGNVAGRAYGLHEKANVCRLTGKLDEADKLYREAGKAWTYSRNQLGLITTLRGMGQSAALRGDIDGAVSSLKRSIQESEHLNSRVGRAYSRHELGVLQSAFDPEAAVDSFRHALEDWNAIHDRRGKAATLIAYGRLLELRGNFHESRTMLIDGYRIVAEIGGMTVSGTGLDQLERYAAESRDSDELQPYLETAMKHCVCPEFVKGITCL